MRTIALIFIIFSLSACAAEQLPDLEQKNAAWKSQPGKIILELFNQDLVNENDIFSAVSAMTVEQINSLDPIAPEIRRLVAKKKLRNKLTNTIDLVKKNSSHSNPDFFYHINALFNSRHAIETSNDINPPEGYFKTDQGYIVEIDGEDKCLTLGKVTSFGTITVINKWQ